MSEIIVYHNNRCSKSRSACQLLTDKKVDFVIREYLIQPPTPSELKALLKKLGMKPVDLLRTGESLYKEQFKGKSFSDAAWIEILCNNPSLMERPIVIRGDKAVIGRPTEKILEIL